MNRYQELLEAAGYERVGSDWRRILWNPREPSRWPRVTMAPLREAVVRDCSSMPTATLEARPGVEGYVHAYDGRASSSMASCFSEAYPDVPAALACPRIRALEAAFNLGASFEVLVAMVRSPG